MACVCGHLRSSHFARSGQCRDCTPESNINGACVAYRENDLDQRRVDALERMADQLERIADRLDKWDGDEGYLDVRVTRRDG